jgi:uncharacterized protein (DUF4213/DUF364 family)
MKILDDLLSSLNGEATVKEVWQGTFQTAVLTRNCGLASTPHDSGPHYDRSPVKDAGELLKKEAMELARLAYSTSAFEASIGMAAINSLLDVEEQRCLEINAGNLIAEKGKGKKVALVGHFPFVPKLRQAAKELWVVEKQPREGDFAEDQAKSLIPQADVVGITGIAFTNHTIEQMLNLCHPQAYVVILGGTTPLSPVLFDHGVDAICGTKVVDTEMVLRCVSQGATFRQLNGVRLLTLKR